MPALTSNTVALAAVDLVKAGLNSKAISLSSKLDTKERAEDDILYINTLINGIAANLSKL